MKTIETIFCIFAASSVFYAISLYISFASETLEDKGTRPKLARFLGIISYPFLILGLGGAAIFGPYNLLTSSRRLSRQIEAMKLVKVIAEINRMDELYREEYWDKHCALYKTSLPYGLWKHKALEEYGIYYYDVFPREF